MRASRWTTTSTDFLLQIVDLKMINIVPRIILAQLLRFLTIRFLRPGVPGQPGVRWTAADHLSNLFLFVSFSSGSCSSHALTMLC